MRHNLNCDQNLDPDLTKFTLGCSSGCWWISHLLWKYYRRTAFLCLFFCKIYNNDDIKQMEIIIVLFLKISILNTKCTGSGWSISFFLYRYYRTPFPNLFFCKTNVLEKLKLSHFSFKFSPEWATLPDVVIDKSVTSFGVTIGLKGIVVCFSVNNIMKI